jgi:hypothetical protein
MLFMRCLPSCGAVVALQAHCAKHNPVERNGGHLHSISKNQPLSVQAQYAVSTPMTGLLKMGKLANGMN